VTSDIPTSIVFKNGPNKNRACQADVPHHAESEGKTRHASGQNKVSQTPLWRIDLSIDRALFRSMLGANNKRPSDEIRKTPISPCKGPQASAQEYVRLAVPRIIRLKYNVPEFDYTSFYGKTGTGGPAALLYRFSVPNLIRCLRTLFNEETALLSVRKFPFPELTPFYLQSHLRKNVRR